MKQDPLTWHLSARGVRVVQTPSLMAVRHDRHDQPPAAALARHAMFLDRNGPRRPFAPHPVRATQQAPAERRPVPGEAGDLAQRAVRGVCEPPCTAPPERPRSPRTVQSGADVRTPSSS